MQKHTQITEQFLKNWEFFNRIGQMLTFAKTALSKRICSTTGSEIAERIAVQTNQATSPQRHQTRAGLAVALCDERAPRALGQVVDGLLSVGLEPAIEHHESARVPVDAIGH